MNTISTSEEKPLLQEHHTLDALWKDIVNSLNAKQIKEAKAIVKHAVGAKEWDKKAMVAYIEAEENPGPTTLAKLEQFSAPSMHQHNLKSDNLALLLINARLAVLCITLAAQSFGELSKCYLKTAEIYTSTEKINVDSAYRKLPLIQFLQLQRVYATEAINAGDHKTSLEMLNKISSLWERIAAGSIDFHPDIPIVLKLIEQTSRKQEILPSMLHENNIDLSEDMLKHSTIRLDLEKYLNIVSKKEKETSLLEIYKGVAERTLAKEISIKVTDSENSITKGILKELNLEGLDGKILKSDHADGKVRIPIILETKITIKDSFVIIDNSPADILLNKGCLNQNTKNHYR